jgi:uncharacterized protein
MSGPVSNEVFLDTSHALALAIASDQFHGRALIVQEELKRENLRLLTTRPVLFEIGNALSKARWRPAAMQLLRAVEADPTVQIVAWSDAKYKQALDLYCNRKDKEWGLVDCLSFVVMEERGITLALTADEHFVQFGCRALLRETGSVVVI